MRVRSVIFHPVIIFVSAQLAWISLVGLWIYWYISNYIIFQTVGDRISPQLASKSINVFSLVVGLVLLAAILVGIYLIFIYLNRQQNLNKLYDNFIANVTHELKSPLASIQLYLDTLNLRQVPPDQQQKFISLMLKDTQRLNNLINSILKLSALEQKKIAHDFHVHAVEKLTTNLIDEAIEQYKLPPGAITITGSVSCYCVIDRNAFKIVFDNLIDNAIKYSQNELKLVIHLKTTAKKCIFEFIDQGIGIQPKGQKKIFNKFYRINHSNIPNVKGTGLGLYWVREIIRYHGGKVTVFSDGLYCGTTFRIELPIYQMAKRRYINYLLRLTRKSERKDTVSGNEIELTPKI